MKLCDKIFDLRKRKGLTQEELANELGVSRQAVFKWESGENTPDLEKIKKIAKIFNISIDSLLNDEIKSEKEAISSIDDEPIKHHLKLRKVFDSGNRINSIVKLNNNYEYPGNNKKINGDHIFLDQVKHDELLSKKNYKKTIRIQKNTLVDFFIDDKNKSFGFFFDGAPQFVCPFENFVSFSIVYDNATMIGTGNYNNSHVGTGYNSCEKNGLPLRYDCLISFFDENGAFTEYNISFDCNANLNKYCDNLKSYENLNFLEASFSSYTNERLNEVSSCLDSIKEESIRIKNGDLLVNPINTGSIANEIKAVAEMKKASTVSNELSKKRKIKVLIVGFIAISVITACIFTTYFGSKLIEQYSISETNRNAAEKVINLINEIDEADISCNQNLIAAEKAYKLLNNDQKALVTNYDKLASTRIKYDQREQDTKDDPTRSILLSDLDGQWTSSRYKITIAGFGGKHGVIYAIYDYDADIGWPATVVLDSDMIFGGRIIGYNNFTRRMEVNLSTCTNYIGIFIKVTLTKSTAGIITMYWDDQIFTKIN